ncbi:MAG TPA: hypothetical protein VG326_18225 [Tepidisphaeraceae bacterium]|jgi:hypothetical protein|nr:hypothetical protein [Tepidisphaeraceae bacterium]
MKRLFRRALFALFLVIAGLAVAGWFVRGRLRARPSWYVRPTLDVETRAAAANSMDQKLIGTWNAAVRAHADEIRARRAVPATLPATATAAPADPIVLQATEDEINASFNKWKATAGWNGGMGKYLSDPILILEDHTIILAATVVLKQMEPVVSLHFTPRLENDKLLMGLSRVTVGTLPVPKSYFGGEVKAMTSAMEEKLPEWREGAHISPRGWADTAAMQAAMAELLINALSDLPADPVLFLPEPRGGRDLRYLPVQIIGIEIADKTLTLTVVPMDADRRETLLQHIRGPLSE